MRLPKQAWAVFYCEHRSGIRPAFYYMYTSLSVSWKMELSDGDVGMGVSKNDKTSKKSKSK